MDPRSTNYLMFRLRWTQGPLHVWCLGQGGPSLDLPGGSGLTCCRLACQVEVNGPGAHPLYQFLRARQPASQPGGQAGRGGAVEWNYTKFLVDRQGAAGAALQPQL